MYITANFVHSHSPLYEVIQYTEPTNDSAIFFD